MKTETAFYCLLWASFLCACGIDFKIWPAWVNQFFVFTCLCLLIFAVDLLGGEVFAK